MRNATLLSITTAAILLLPACTRSGPSTDDERERTQSAQSEASVRVAEGFSSATLEGQTEPQGAEGEEGSVEEGAAADHPNTHCTGYFPDEPGHTIDIEEARQLRILAEPSGALRDLTMAILTPGGDYLCNDDFDALNPGFEQMFQPGSYSVWVGVYRLDEVNGSVGYSLTVSDPLAAVTSSAPEGPAPTATSEGTYGGLRIAADTGAAQIQGRAGGTRAANELSPQCAGHIAMEPDHVFELEATTALKLRVRSQRDTTLLLQGPGGEVLCNDDFDGLNPGMDAELAQGTWSVYVGTYSPSSYPEYTLNLSR